jgi:hypothetical protein
LGGTEKFSNNMPVDENPHLSLPEPSSWLGGIIFISPAANLIYN